MTRWILAIFVLVATAAPVVGDRSAADRALRGGDRAEAVRIWAAQAGQGDRDAQQRLAYALEEGLGVTADGAAAARWYLAAARQGHVGAQTAIASMFHEGRGVEQDATEAFVWAMAAAEQGSAAAAHLLGRLYLEGDAVAADPAMAFRWFFVAERLGHVSAAHDRRRSGRLLTIEARREIRADIVQQIAY
ncbi:tetratricopeptide repeat protein [Stella sp.]|uniref:tetratricopeptide repeat protein n=1 Tax=Stella sp. TaxID=2912054 RepID=UPI0035AF4433